MIFLPCSLLAAPRVLHALLYLSVTKLCLRKLVMFPSHWLLLSASLSSGDHSRLSLQLLILTNSWFSTAALAPHAASAPGTPGARTKLINWAAFGWLCQTTALSAPEMQAWNTWADPRRANRGEFISLGYASPLIFPSEACLICFEPLHCRLFHLLLSLFMLLDYNFPLFLLSKEK